MVNKKEQPKRLYSTKIASEIPGAIQSPQLSVGNKANTFSGEAAISAEYLNQMQGETWNSVSIDVSVYDYDGGEQ